MIRTWQISKGSFGKHCSNYEQRRKDTHYKGKCSYSVKQPHERAETKFKLKCNWVSYTIFMELHYLALTILFIKHGHIILMLEAPRCFWVERIIWWDYCCPGNAQLGGPFTYPAGAGAKGRRSPHSNTWDFNTDLLILNQIP